MISGPCVFTGTVPVTVNSTTFSEHLAVPVELIPLLIQLKEEVLVRPER